MVSRLSAKLSPITSEIVVNLPLLGTQGHTHLANRSPRRQSDDGAKNLVLPARDADRLTCNCILPCLLDEEIAIEPHEIWNRSHLHTGALMELGASKSWIER